MNAVLPVHLSIDEFLRWSRDQERGRFELEGGRIVPLQAENVGHVRTKRRATEALAIAIATAGVPFYVLPDGPLVRISEDRGYEPDALVAPLPMPPDDALVVPDPVIVIEVLSPSPASQERDLVSKVEGYGRVPSIAFYVVLDPVERQVFVWTREGRVLAPPAGPSEGAIRLDPPGIVIAAEAFFDVASNDSLPGAS